MSLEKRLGLSFLLRRTRVKSDEVGWSSYIHNLTSQTNREISCTLCAHSAFLTKQTFIDLYLKGKDTSPIHLNSGDSSSKLMDRRSWIGKMKCLNPCLPSFRDFLRSWVEISCTLIEQIALSGQKTCQLQWFVEITFDDKAFEVLFSEKEALRFPLESWIRNPCFAF